MNPFASRITGNSWVIPVLLLSLVLGIMVRMAWVTKDTVRDRSRYFSPDQQSRVLASFQNVQDETAAMNAEIAKLREENTKLQNAMGEGTSQNKILNESLQQTKVYAALTDVEGPGISVILKDGKPREGIGDGEIIIHDVDVLRLVNELRAAGAEAITVNNHRVSGSTSFTCVGPTIYVNGTAVTTPIKVNAIGDPEALTSGIKFPTGVVTEIRSADESMVQILTLKNMRMPPFTGSTTTKFLKVPTQPK
ncbi:MAG TPA: DUF881 domain-containing protein [Fimbriimonadaceae bacterium]|nr:DUF881 domain-containing protein [Fimbriimonadaceae bacterium]